MINPKLKELLTNKKLINTLLALLLAYLGYNEVSDYYTIEVLPVKETVNSTEVIEQHEHMQKDWNLTIDNKVQNAIDKHNDNYHGGN